MMKCNTIKALKLSKGQNVRKAIEQYLYDQKCQFVKIEAIGMLENVEIGYYQGSKKDHQVTKYVKPHELTSFVGNAFFDGQKVILHAHVTLAGEDNQVIGGHFIDGTVAVIMECMITPVTGTKNWINQ